MASRKKSLFPVVTSVSAGASVDFWANGVNYQISYDNFISGLGVTGTIVQDGDPAGVPVLDTQGTVNNIRNIEPGSGVTPAVSPQNGIQLNHTFINDTTGAELLTDLSELNPKLRSIVGQGGISAVVDGDTVVLDGSAAGFSNRVIVNKPSDLSGTLDSSKEYFVDGVVDMGAQSIEVPAAGLNLKGFGFGISGLITSSPNHNLFVSPAGGSGNLFVNGVEFGVTGINSGVFALTSDTGNEAVELVEVNFNNCTSLGYLDGYRQGLELNTGRFGGTPSLELRNTWAGGYRITTSIVRGIDNAMTNALFKAGAGFTMASRFLTDINADLGATAPLLDFSSSNFANPSTLQLDGCIITRNGVRNSADSTITPNILPSELPCDWDDNQGLPNTFVGGTSNITAEVATVVGGIGAFVDLLGTFNATDLQHFDAPANGQLRHIGDSPREFRMFGDLVVVGTAGDEIEVKIVKWDDSAGSFSDIASQRRQVNALVGGRDVAFFNATTTFTLDRNDYIKLQVANNTAVRNVTAEIDSFYTVLER
jgi:hypothetical protein